jgi:anti-anti-sigma regulatory factor
MVHSLPSLLNDSSNRGVLSEMSGFRRRVNEIFDLLGPYAALFGSLLPKFRDSLQSHIQGSNSPSLFLDCSNVRVSFQILK